MATTTTTSPAPDTALPNLRGWAAAQLELRPDAAPAQARAALLRRLPEDDFVPPYRIQQAALFMLRPAAGAEPLLRQGQAQYDEEDRLRIEVDAFAAEFFKLDVAERRRRWQELCGRCAFSPALAGWLGGLERGLGVPLTSLAGTAVFDLAGHIGALFVLRPAARASRRLTLLSEMRSEPARWQAAARQLQKQAPPVVALSPPLVEELANWEKALQQQRKRAAAIPAVQSSAGGVSSTYRLGAGRQRQGLVPATSDSKSGSAWPVGLIVIVVIAVLRLAFSNSGSSSNAPRFTIPTYPRFVAPDFKANDDLERIIRDLNNGKPPDPKRNKVPDDFVPKLDDLRRQQDRERNKKLDDLPKEEGKPVPPGEDSPGPAPPPSQSPP